MSIPTRLGRYRILNEISRGAMGCVYLAHDPDIDRKVAIKTIRTMEGSTPLETEQTRQRFNREARAAGRLQHPGIVTIFDVGVDNGVAYIAMELIDGDTLENYTTRGKLLPVPRVIDLMIQACEALDYAHNEKVVHRDIKPANLMLLENGRLKITDFGLAKNPSTSLTHDGTLMGTPNYMSPEQVQGKPLDGRSDLFSLSAVFYEMLTGSRPFGGESVTTIIYRIAHESPREPGKINPLITAPVEKVVMKGLAKNPDQRFQSGKEFIAALQARAVAAIGAPEAAPLPKATPQITKPPAARAPAKAGPRPRVAPAPARPVSPRKTSWKGALVRGVVLSLLAVALVLLLPAQATKDDRWGRGDVGDAPPFYATAGLLQGPGEGGGTPGKTDVPMPQVTVPGAEESILITFRTDPPGGAVYFDDVEAPEGKIRLAEGDTTTHTLVAENDCFIETREYTLGDEETVAIPLKTPKFGQLEIVSDPKGAAITLDGKRTGEVTPAELTVALCAEHTVVLKKTDYQDATRTIEGLAGPLEITLKPVPKGFLRLASPYPVQIYQGKTRLGKDGDSIRLTAGRHSLRLRNNDFFVDRTVTVTIRPDTTVSPDPGLPGLGSLTVLASPSNCTIFVEGREIGSAPINDFPLAAGTYTVRAVYVPTGEARETVVHVQEGGAARVPFRFSP